MDIRDDCGKRGFQEMLRVRQIKIKLELDTKEEVIKETCKKLGIKKEELTFFQIRKQSLDARKKEEIHYVYEVEIETPKEAIILKKKHSNDIVKTEKEQYKIEFFGEKKLKNRPIIVGSGPAGLFASYILAENNYHPIIIERGEKVEDRVNTVNEFWKTRKLNKNSNVQFGEGGAGTFSDGKLNTLVKDSHSRFQKVFETFIEAGAPEEIRYLQKPHIGTDLLRIVVKNMREKIISMGGEFRYNTCLTDIFLEDGKVKEIEVNHQEKIPCDCLVLAIGHSARDTFHMLYEKKLNMEAKPFALGIRIEHPQDMINKSQYKDHYNLLPPASYKLTYTTKENRGVYSFCMCPGGYVVNASSEEGRLAINGMSDYKRDSENANSAIVVTVTPSDFGNHPLDGINYQQNLEEKAYQEGQGKIPVQLWKDFKENKTSTSFLEVSPVFKGEVTFGNLNHIFPVEIINALKEAIPFFGTKIEGYDREDAILAGIESRTSSPVRIIRDDNFVSNYEGIYPCGEGAGYAGGITTAAIDGIKVAEKIIALYKGED